MHPDFARRLLSAALVAAFVLAAPAHAAKKRSVRKPEPPPKVVASKINGTVLDAVTNQPIVFAHVEALNDGDNTDKLGKFELKNVESYGEISVAVERTGYVRNVVRFNESGDRENLTIKLQPLPTTTIKKTDGTTYTVDTDSVTFGYAVPFSGYRDAPFDDFCMPNGAQTRIDRDHIKKITGPATLVSVPSCCSQREVEKISLQLRTGETTDAYFVDSCDSYSVDVLARDHLTGKSVYVSFKDIAEVVFP